MKNNNLIVFVVTLMLAAFSSMSWALDINKASAAELQKELSGIGPVKAKAIVDYRKKHGKFKTTDDLLKVPGIGAATVKKNLSKTGLKKGKKSLSSAKSSSKKASSKKTAVKSKKDAAKSSLKSKSKDKAKGKVKDKSKAKAKSKAKDKLKDKYKKKK